MKIKILKMSKDIPTPTTKVVLKTIISKKIFTNHSIMRKKRKKKNLQQATQK